MNRTIPSYESKGPSTVSPAPNKRNATQDAGYQTSIWGKHAYTTMPNSSIEGNSPVVFPS